MKTHVHLLSINVPYLTLYRLRIEKLVVKGKQPRKLKENNLMFALKDHSDRKTQGSELPLIPISNPKIFLRKVLTNNILSAENKLDKESKEREKETEENNVKEKKTYYKIKTFNKGSINIGIGNNQEEEWVEEMNRLQVSNINLPFNKYSKAKKSNSSTGNIKAYGVNSYQGIIRAYNEDRVAIILSISKPHNYEGQWPNCSFFAIYDGHGGNKCCDFLRDKLQDYIIKNKYFPLNPRSALLSGIEKVEYDFIQQHALDSSGELIDKSGSCALITLIVDDICYVANIGDSRMVLSKNKGRTISVITTDHKPNNEKESMRIIKNGGRVYQTNPNGKMNDCSPKKNNLPHRIYPGGLSVSRAIGDVEAKLSYLGGMNNVLIATPEITQFPIDKETDFFIMGCDGIFDYLSNEECVECAWMTLRSKKHSQSIHSKSAAVVDMIMKSSLKRKTFDNVTAIFVAFDSFEQSFNKRFRDTARKRETNQDITKQVDVLNTEATESNLVFKTPKLKLKIKKEIVVQT